MFTFSTILIIVTLNVNVVLSLKARTVRASTPGMCRTSYQHRLHSTLLVRSLLLHISHPGKIRDKH